MTLFEYLAAANTLTLSFAVARMLSGVPHALRPGRRYWVHVSWLAVALVFCLVSFWGFWSNRDSGIEWTLPRFVGALAPATMIYVYSSLVVPADSPNVPCWQEYFFETRIPLFATGILVMAAVGYSNVVLRGAPPFDLISLPSWALAAIFAFGLASSNPRLHAGLALAIPLVIVATVMLVAEPGSLTR